MSYSFSPPIFLLLPLFPFFFSFFPPRTLLFFISTFPLSFSPLFFLPFFSCFLLLFHFFHFFFSFAFFFRLFISFSVFLSQRRLMNHQNITKINDYFIIISELVLDYLIYILEYNFRIFNKYVFFRLYNQLSDECSFGYKQTYDISNYEISLQVHEGANRNFVAVPPNNKCEQTGLWYTPMAYHRRSSRTLLATSARFLLYFLLN